MATGVYRIVNTKTNEVYYGSTNRSFQERWRVHRGQLRRHQHPNSRLQDAYDRYGMEALHFEVVEEIEGEDALLRRERYYINLYWGQPHLYNQQRLRSHRVQRGG